LDATVGAATNCATSIHVSGIVKGGLPGMFTGDFTLEDSKGNALCVD
jgi:hypothetical protein